LATRFSPLLKRERCFLIGLSCPQTNRFSLRGHRYFAKSWPPSGRNWILAPYECACAFIRFQVLILCQVPSCLDVGRSSLFNAPSSPSLTSDLAEKLLSFSRISDFFEELPPSFFPCSPAALSVSITDEPLPPRAFLSVPYSPNLCCYAVGK